MNNTITLTGTILFEPEDKTKKHISQASWKKIVMVMLSGDVCEYYSWFIFKRYGLTLNKPLRKAHVTFINDSLNDFTKGGLIPLEEVEKSWNELKVKWNKKKIDVVLSLEPKTNDLTWWLNIPHENRHELQAIREEVGLGKPFFGMHMSIGYANERNIEHSRYIHTLIKKGLITT